MVSWGFGTKKGVIKLTGFWFQEAASPSKERPRTMAIQMVPRIDMYPLRREITVGILAFL